MKLSNQHFKVLMEPFSHTGRHLQEKLILALVLTTLIHKKEVFYREWLTTFTKRLSRLKLASNFA